MCAHVSRHRGDGHDQLRREAEEQSERLLRAAAHDCDAYVTCPRCGEEVCLAEPDACDVWCDNCRAVVEIHGLPYFGLI